MVSLNHPFPHRKCIGFADLKVNCTLLPGAIKFQEQQLNYEISNILIANSDYLVGDCWPNSLYLRMDGALKSATDSEFTTRT